MSIEFDVLYYKKLRNCSRAETDGYYIAKCMNLKGWRAGVKGKNIFQ